MSWIWNAGGNDGVNDTRNLSKPDGWRHGVVFLPLKAILVAAGWTVEGSGDGDALYEFRGTTGGAGTGSGGAYDVWTSDDGTTSVSAGNVSNALAWCVLKAPTGTMQILMVGTTQAASGWDAYGNILFSHADGYVAAGISATVPPATVTDEKAVIGGTRPFSSGEELISFSTAGYVHIGANTEAVAGYYGFWWATVNTSGTRFNSLQLSPIFGARSWDVAPYLWQAGIIGEHGFTWEKKGLTSETWFNNFGWPAALLFDKAYWRASSYFDPETSDLPMGEPMIIGRSGVVSQEHFRGVLPHSRMRAATSDGTTTADYPSITEQDPDGLVWLHWNDLALPWDDTVSPPTPSGGSGGVTNVEWLSMSDLTPTVASTADFNVVAFDPLRNGLISSTDTTLVLQISQASGTLNTSQVTIQINHATILQGGVFVADFSGSSIVAAGGGVFTFTLVKSTPWILGSNPQVDLYLPGESP